MRVLALEPYYGGSHRAFLDGWAGHSRHAWTVLALPPFKWKWRMRHAAATFAEQTAERVRRGEAWDIVFCSDMLNLAEFRGLAPASLRELPAVVYFHENQLTYPVRVEQERDYHFALTNITTALAAEEAWFNSQFHRQSFLAAAAEFLRKMPDHPSPHWPEQIESKSLVQYPGIESFARRGRRPPGPLRILWAARWEHDKDPDTFFAAVEKLDARAVSFRLSVIGESFRETPAVFAPARERFADKIDRWGHQATREEYKRALAEADVIVSTANHEFFGISVVEAIASGAFPLLPGRLAYPEVLETIGAPPSRHLYNGSAGQLVSRLEELARQVGEGPAWKEHQSLATAAAEQFSWRERAAKMDDRLEALT